MLVSCDAKLCLDMIITDFLAFETHAFRHVCGFFFSAYMVRRRHHTLCCFFFSARRLSTMPRKNAPMLQRERSAATQAMVDKWAAEFFNERERKFLRQLFGGKAYFDYEEYQTLASSGFRQALRRVAMGDNGNEAQPVDAPTIDAKTSLFYRAALTLDRIIEYIQSLEAAIATVEPYDDEIVGFLDGEIPTLEDIQANRGHNAAGEALADDVPKDFLRSHTLTSSILRLLRGIVMQYPQMQLPEWVGHNAILADDGGIPDDDPDAGVFSASLSNALKRSRVFAALIKMVDALIKKWSQIRKKLPGDVYGQVNQFAWNFRTGEMKYANNKCPPGMIPQLWQRGAADDAAPLQGEAYKNAYVKIGGKTYLAPYVDPDRTTCVESVAIDDFGARHRRRPRVMRAAKLPAGFMSRRRTTTRAMPKRNSKGQFVKSSRTMRASVWRPELHAAKLPAGFMARRRTAKKKAPTVRRPRTLHARGITRPRVAPWSDMYDIDSGLESVNPLDFEARRRRPRKSTAVRRPRAHRAQIVDPAKFAALQVKEALMARRRPRARKHTTTRRRY